jgi:hypothetical protein
MASVPAHYIKNKHVDYDGEIFACMNLPIEVSRIRISPPPFGVFSLLEVIDSKFIKDFKNSDAMDFVKALYIAAKGKHCAAEVMEWVYAGGKQSVDHAKRETWLEWDKEVSKFADHYKIGEMNVADIPRFRKFLIDNAFSGYDMIPEQGGGEFMPYLFGAETMASVVAVAGYDAIWNMPLCMVGHIAAAKARSNGVKGVARPKDQDDIKKQLKDADERELKGELHPWQIKEPDMYGLSADQIKARPAVKEEYQKILKAHLRAKREKESASNG